MIRKWVVCSFGTNTLTWVKFFQPLIDNTFIHTYVWRMLEKLKKMKDSTEELSAFEEEEKRRKSIERIHSVILDVITLELRDSE